MLSKIFFIFFICLYLPLYVNANQYVGNHPIEYKILGHYIFDLYKEFGFFKIEKDNEYSDLKPQEEYWLAIDSRHEYITLRTNNKIIKNIIINNPDLYTTKGIQVGDTYKKFISIHPEALKVNGSHNLDEVLDIYWVENKNIEITFYKRIIFSINICIQKECN